MEKPKEKIDWGEYLYQIEIALNHNTIPVVEVERFIIDLQGCVELYKDESSSNERAVRCPECGTAQVIDCGGERYRCCGCSNTFITKL